MKFEYKAVDQTGKPVQGILEATDEEAARLLLLDASIFPKKMSPVDADKPITWRPRSASAVALQDKVSKARDPNAEKEKLVASLSLTQFIGNQQRSVRMDLYDQRIVLKSDNEDPVEYLKEKVETSMMSGFIQRRWEVILTSGEALTFHAGTFYRTSEIIRAHRHIQYWARG